MPKPVKTSITIWHKKNEDELVLYQRDVTGNILVEEVGSLTYVKAEDETFAVQTCMILSMKIAGPAVVRWHVVSLARYEKPIDVKWPEVLEQGTQVVLDTGESVTVKVSTHPTRGLASVVEDQRGIIYDHGLDKYRWMNPGDWH